MTNEVQRWIWKQYPLTSKKVGWSIWKGPAKHPKGCSKPLCRWVSVWTTRIYAKASKPLLDLILAHNFIWAQLAPSSIKQAVLSTIGRCNLFLYFCCTSTVFIMKCAIYTLFVLCALYFAYYERDNIQKLNISLCMRFSKIVLHAISNF